MKYKIFLILFLTPFCMFAQNDLLNVLDSVAEPVTNYESATFKTTRIITGHSIESMKAGQLEFRISHRFGKMNSGVGELFGIDQAIIYLGFQYGVTDWLELGYGRTPDEKTYQGFTKLRLYRQSTGKTNMPVAITYFGSIGINSATWDYPDRTNYFTSRLSFAHQVLIARKFTENLSLQLTPTLIHRNIVPTSIDNNDVYAIGLGGRYKFSNRSSFNFEYFYVVRPPNASTIYTNPVSLGVDIETGGHVFQIMVTNSRGMIEKHYIAENAGDFKKGEIHLGFNISRVFTIFGN